MQKFKNLIFLVSVMFLILGSSFSSFAMVPLNIDQLVYFENGPWTTVRCGFYSVNEDGTFARMAVPSWRDGSGAGTNYYSFTNNNRPYTDIYMIADDFIYNFAIEATEPLLELYLYDHDGVLLSSALDDAFLGEKDGKYYYGISIWGKCGFGLRGSGTIIMSEYSSAFDGGDAYDAIQSLLPIVSGVYDGNSVAVRYPGMSWNDFVQSPLSRTASYGFDKSVFPLTMDQAYVDGAFLTFKFNISDGFLRDGSDYDFVYKILGADSAGLYIGDSSGFVESSVVNNTVNLSITGTGVSLSDLKLGMIIDNNYFDRICHAVAFKYVSSMSDDIGTVPPDDDDGGGGSSGSPDYSAAIGQIGSTLKELLNSQDSSTTTIVNNITNATTTISNTISNVSTQITNTLQSVQQGIENKLQGVEEGISGTIEQSNQELIQNDEKLHSEKLEADKENTQAVTDAVEEHGNFIIEGLKGLFIPSDEFFKTYFDDLYEFFNDKFGFLSFPIDLLVRLVDLFVNSSDKDCILTLPEFEISGEKLITEASFNLTEFLENDFGILLSSIRLVTSIGLIMAFVNLCQDKWNEVMRN